VHLHIPDGVLPAWLWLPGLGAALALLAVSARAGAAASRQRIAYQATLGALALGAMAVEIPLGPLEYHLTLIGPIGVLLGPVASYQALFIVNAILALVGHGGLTTVGLNALVLGAGAAVARPAYLALARRLATGPALATATAVAQTLSGVLWLALLGVALRLPGAGIPAPDTARVGLVAALAFPVWLIGIGAESAVAFGVARFLERVRPDLLPAPRAPEQGDGNALAGTGPTSRLAGTDPIGGSAGTGPTGTTRSVVRSAGGAGGPAS